MQNAPIAALSITSETDVVATPAETRHRCIGWFDDGRAGHRQQIQALVQALSRSIPLGAHAISPLSPVRAMAVALRRQPPDDWPQMPDVLIGCGHRSHLSLLAGGRATGAATVVLMRPSLPLALFDHALVPEHDQPPQRANVLATVGALASRPERAEQVGRDRSLVLLGGPSRHGRWNSDQVIAQVLELLASQTEQSWVISNSPRTPAELLPRLRAMVPASSRVVFNDVGEQTTGWLARQLPACHSVWLTPDSASMVYQALTAGCGVGLLTLPRPRRSRVRDGLDRLVEQGMVTDWQRYVDGEQPLAPRQPLFEAERAADWLLARLGWSKQ